jgi:probable HAF family extracellular repeat protein
MPTYTYTTIDDPSGRNTLAFGINDAGQVVGEYVSNGIHGFLYSGGTYTTLDDPSSSNVTEAFGINDTGQIVGTYQDAGFRNHGFLYSGGTYTTVDDPLADPSRAGTEANGINNADRRSFGEGGWSLDVLDEHAGRHIGWLKCEHFESF